MHRGCFLFGVRKVLGHPVRQNDSDVRNVGSCASDRKRLRSDVVESLPRIGSAALVLDGLHLKLDFQFVVVLAQCEFRDNFSAVCYQNIYFKKTR